MLHSYAPFGMPADSAGTLPFRAIIHVAGIGLLWRASRQSIQLSVRNAIALAKRQHFRTIALPLIGAGTGAFNPTRPRG